MTKIAIGLVGYYHFVRGYPIGPELSERLKKLDGDDFTVDVKDMNWGPIAIVQDFQASTFNYDRVILISAVDRGLSPGSVTCRHWQGGKLDTLAVQDRVFEAVTGIISIDNLLIIGEHFGIWPKELITIEVQLSETAFGDLVLSELDLSREQPKMSVVGANPLAPEMADIVERIYAMTEIAVTDGVGGLADIIPINAKQLNPLTDVIHNQFLDTASQVKH